MPDTATDAILLVLKNSRVRAEHSPEDIAAQIFAMFGQWGVRLSRPEDREREKAELAALPSRSLPVERLPYSIDVFDPAGAHLEVLGRESLIVPARSAFKEYAAVMSDRQIVLRQGMQVLARSDRQD